MTGKTWADAVTNFLLIPLGMKSTFTDPVAAAQSKNYAIGVALDATGYLPLRFCICLSHMWVIFFQGRPSHYQLMSTS